MIKGEFACQNECGNVFGIFGFYLEFRLSIIDEPLNYLSMEVILALLISLGVLSEEAYSTDFSIDEFEQYKEIIIESGEDYEGILAHCEQEGDL